MYYFNSVLLVQTVFEYCQYTKKQSKELNESQKGAGISDNGLLFMERDTSRVDLLCNLSKHNLHRLFLFSFNVICLRYFCHTDNFRNEVGDPVIA